MKSFSLLTVALSVLLLLLLPGLAFAGCGCGGGGVASRHAERVAARHGSIVMYSSSSDVSVAKSTTTVTGTALPKAVTPTVSSTVYRRSAVGKAITAPLRFFTGGGVNTCPGGVCPTK